MSSRDSQHYIPIEYSMDSSLVFFGRNHFQGSGYEIGNQSVILKVVS